MDLTQLIPEKTRNSPAFGIVLALVALGSLIVAGLLLYNQYETARLTQLDIQERQLDIEIAKRELNGQ